MLSSLYKELRFYASSLNILIVDDEKEITEGLNLLLEKIFLNCHTASNGVEALKLYEKNRYDIVLTDINMPKMNGMELSKAIKSKNSNQCILVLSGYIDTFVIDLIDIGINGLILKPYEHTKFFQTLCKNAENIVLKKEFNRLLFKQKNRPERNEKTHTPLVNKMLQENEENNLSIKDIDTNLYKKPASINMDSWDSIKEDIKELNYNMSELIDYIMLNGVSQKYIDDLSHIFNAYYSNLLLVDNLEEFSLIFQDIAEFFETMNIDELDENIIKNFDTYLYIYDDLIEFFDLVFEKKSTENINYLTDSLKSSVYQMKCTLSNTSLDEEDLEIF